LLAFIDQKSTSHNGTSIYHRIVRSALLIKNWRVENLTARLFANKFVNIVATALQNVEVVEISVGDDFAHRLHGELTLVVAQLSELTIDGAECRSEPFWTCLEKTWNV